MIQESKNQKVDFKVMSSKTCNICKRPIKQNVVNKNPNVCLCFVCFKLSKGQSHSNEKGNKISLFDLHVDNCRRYGGKVSFIQAPKFDIFKELGTYFNPKNR
jgi:hypothetical protein